MKVEESKEGDGKPTKLLNSEILSNTRSLFRAFKRFY